ncbi:hypothetical protein GTB64_004453 [Salmonella enterica]|nr:hypothetical protein [Salmonella enterica]
MYQWVKVVEAKGFQVCIEKGVEEGCPAITFRITKGGGILRARMCIEPLKLTEEYVRRAVEQRDEMFKTLDQETIDAAVNSLLEMEPDMLDGSGHGFVIGE